MCDNSSLTVSPDCLEEYDDQENEEGGDPLRDFKIILGFQILFVILGVIGNTLMFALMLRKRFRNQSYAPYFAFAAVFDTANIILNCVLDASEVFDEVVHLEKIAINYGCKVFHFFEGLILMASPWFIVVLTIDRVLAVCFAHKTWAQKYCRPKVAIGVCIVMLLCLIIYNIPWTVLTDTYYFEDEEFHECSMPGDHMDNSFYSSLAIAVLLPILLLTVLNGFIAYSLIRGRAGESQLTDQMRYIRRFNLIIFYILIMTLLTWIPITVVELVELSLSLEDRMTEELEETISKAWKACLVVYLITFVQNFYIFILTSASYRYELAKMFHLQRYLKDPYDTINFDQPMKEVADSYKSDNKI